VELAGSGDIILVAGKGHENNQETGSEKIPFDDVHVTARAMAEKPFAEMKETR